jgi:hypothetical protein
MMRSSVLLLVSILGLLACGPRESGRKQHIEFAAFTVDEGVYKPKPGWTFTKGTKKSTIIARQNTGPGVVITPCECSLETGGSCAQVIIDGPDGQIREVFCDDNGCGFCVGGTGEPGDPTAVRFNVPYIAGRKVTP